MPLVAIALRPSVELVLAALQIIGLAAYAAAGVFAARRKGLDLVGAISIAFLTAFGGGSLRDVLLGRAPVFWVRFPHTAIEVLVVAAATFYLARVYPEDAPRADDLSGPARSGPQSLAVLSPPRRIVRVIAGLDALGLGVFGASGAAYSLASGTGYFIAALMAVVTGCFGGVLRDVILNEIPIVFQQRTELYATCAFAGVWIYLGLRSVGVPDAVALALGAIGISSFRVLAMAFHWSLPRPRA